MKRFFLGGIVVLGGIPDLGAQLFSEDFNDGLAASRWGVVSQQEVGNTSPADGAVEFGFNYGSLGIANPQGGADTTGARIRLNLTVQGGLEGESYSIYPTGQTFSGDFVLRMDMFVYNGGGTGTTEYGMAGIYRPASGPVSPMQAATVGGPLAWAYTGEGGAVNDLITFRDGDASNPGFSALAVSNYNDIPSIPGFETGVVAGFPSAGPAGPTSPEGAFSNGSWVRLRIERISSSIQWFLNDALVDTYDNTSGSYDAVNLLIGGEDPFSSVGALEGGVIVDNVVVTVPEPSTWLFVTVATVLALAKRRRMA